MILLGFCISSQDKPTYQITHFYPHIFLSLYLSLYSSLTLPSKSKSCITIVTAAVYENYLLPLPFFLCVFPVTFSRYCFDVRTQSRELKKGVVVREVYIGEQQSRAAGKKRKGGIRGKKKSKIESKQERMPENIQTDNPA